MPIFNCEKLLKIRGYAMISKEFLIKQMCIQKGEWDMKFFKKIFDHEYKQL